MAPRRVPAPPFRAHRRSLQRPGLGQRLRARRGRARQRRGRRPGSRFPTAAPALRVERAVEGGRAAGGGPRGKPLEAAGGAPAALLGIPRGQSGQRPVGVGPGRERVVQRRLQLQGGEQEETVRRNAGPGPPRVEPLGQGRRPTLAGSPSHETRAGAVPSDAALRGAGLFQRLLARFGVAYRPAPSNAERQGRATRPRGAEPRGTFLVRLLARLSLIPAPAEPPHTAAGAEPASPRELEDEFFCKSYVLRLRAGGS